MSINDNLAKWLLSNEGFSKEYEKLLKGVVSSQLGSGFESNEEKQTYDWQYLLYCASIFTATKNEIGHNHALRIAQSALNCENLGIVYRDSAAIILERLANFPALKLAEERKFLSGNIEQRLPTYTKLKWIREKYKQQALLHDGSSIELSNFQKDFWDNISNIQMASVSAPTAAGKSYVIKLWISELIKNSQSTTNVIFLVPTRALILEVEKNFKDLFKGMGKEVNVTSAPLPMSGDKKKANIFIFTQERFQIFLNENPLSFKIDILIVDEAHKIGDKYRGVLLQQVLENIVETSPLVKVLFLSPLTSNPEVLLQDYKGSSETDVFKSTQNTVSQNLFWCRPLHGLPKQWNLSLLNEGKEIPLGRLHLPHNPGSDTKKMAMIATAIGRSTNGNIVYVDGASAAEKVALQICSFLGEDFIKNDKEIDELIKLAKDQIHSEYYLVQTLKWGVAFHYGNMPDIIRSEIERLFSSGKVSFLVCTSTLIEGVNTSCKNIFARNPKRGKNTPMTIDDFWNLAGRAGRWGKEFQGNIFCIDPENWENTAPIARTEFQITRSTDKSIENVDYLTQIIDGTVTNETDRTDEYVYSYIYSQYKTYGTLEKTKWQKRFPKTSIEKLDESLKNADAKIEVPFQIIERHPGISPNYINDLLDYLETRVENDNRPIEDFIPPSPDDENAVNLYAQLLMRMANIFHLKYDLAAVPAHAWSNAIVIVGWMRGYPLARIISSRIAYDRKKTEKALEKKTAYKSAAALPSSNDEKKAEINALVQKNSSDNTPNLIREVMEKVETIARFYAPKYLSCYAEVLEHFLLLKGKPEYAENLSQFAMLLEYGVSTRTQVTFIGIGLSRATTLAITEFIDDDAMVYDAALDWLKKGKYRNLTISGVMKREMDALLVYLGENSEL